MDPLPPRLTSESFMNFLGPFIHLCNLSSIELKRLEQELFNHCKVQETDPKANSGILLRVSHL